MENIKKLRQLRGMTQKDLATLLGIKQQTICKYENTCSDISLHILRKLSYIFKVPIDALIDEEMDIIDYIKNEGSNLSILEKKIIDMIKRLDGRKLVCLMKFLNGLNNQ